MQKITVGWSLSFDNVVNETAAAILSGSCRFKPEKNKFFIQAPKLGEINGVLNKFGYEIELDESGKKQYESMSTVIARFDKDIKAFKVEFSAYPSYPYFTTSEKKRNIWLNVARRVENETGIFYEIKHVYQLIDAMDWLKQEGFTVAVKDSVKPFLPAITPGIATIRSMDRQTTFTVKQHQVDGVDQIERMEWRGVVGDDPGLGKTIDGGEIILRLFKAGKARRVLWVVPTSPLVKQVRDEMLSRYALDGAMVTGETIKPRERLGRGGTGLTIYEKHGFIITTWAMLIKDFAGANYWNVTKRIYFDAIILDEGHRCQIHNVANSAVLNLTAPYRVILSGTIMPNGDWRELHAMVSAVAPVSVMAPWVFAQLEKDKEEELKPRKNIADPRQEARKIVTRMVLAMLLPRVTRHVKEDYADFLPSLSETEVHVETNKKESEIIEVMIDMLSKIITQWQSVAYMKFSGNKREKEYAMIVENAKNVVWQDLRRFCSHGSFSLQRRVEEIWDGASPIHVWLRQNYEKSLQQVKDCMQSGEVRPQPKNEKLLDVLSKINPERCLVFCNSVIGCIEIGKFLTGKGIATRVVVGSDDQMTDEDGDIIGQSSRIDDEELARIIEWFWFPWITITSLETVDPSIAVAYRDSAGHDAGNHLFYVDGYKLGKSFTISISWTKTTADAIEKVNGIISSLASRSIVMDVEVPSKKDAWQSPGTMIVGAKFTGKKDARVLVTTDKLNEGANLQIANTVIFYDCPLSIKQKEQRIARVRRMESQHKAVILVKLLEGLDYAIERSVASTPQVPSTMLGSHMASHGGSSRRLASSSPPTRQR
jgi:superfamily II DNA or RNA helicase